jgi:TfoX/Sxy family transcriptional regulator of competence genes
MAYDKRLVDRMRELVEDQPGLTEQTMFGGHAFLIDGNMAVAASGQGGALVRVDPADAARLIATTPAQPMFLGGRSMGSGWVHVGAEHVRTRRQLIKWVELGLSTARSLSPRRTQRR